MVNHPTIPQPKNILQFLQERNAPILRADIGTFGNMFQFGWHAYEMVGREGLEGTSFVRRLYTPQYNMPSLAHRDVLDKAERPPKGAGEVYDQIHATLRSLGNRIAQVFTPAIREVIDNEVDKVRKEDRPPSPAAKGKLTKAKIFEGTLTDAVGGKHLLQLKNVPIEHLKGQSSLLETALALREQAIEAFGRNISTFEWIRDNIELQSTETLEQILEVLGPAIAKQCPDKSLSDFRLEVTLDERCEITRSIFRHIHDLRRDYALMTIIDPIEHSRLRYGYGPNLPLNAVGESEQGFRVSSPLDAAAVVASMQQGGEILQFAVPENERTELAFPHKIKSALRKTAERIAVQRDLDHARSILQKQWGTIEEADQWNRKQHPIPGIDPTLGIARAVEILRSF